MSPPKASTRSSYDADSDSDAPESVPLSQSKRQVRLLETSLKHAELAERRSKKMLNRTRDRVLKERAERNKEAGGKGRGKDKGKGKDRGKDKDGRILGPDESGDKGRGKGKGKLKELAAGDVNGLESRMKRAMQDALDESEVDGEGEDATIFGGIGDYDVEMHSDDRNEQDESSAFHSNEEQDEDDDENQQDDSVTSMDETSEHEVTKPSSSSSSKRAGDPKIKSKLKPNYLPDELFSAAFSRPKRALSSPEDDALESDEDASKHSAKKRKTTKKKDLLVGSRAIRILPSSHHPGAFAASHPGMLQPSKKIKRFIDHSLALKTGKESLMSRGWERRPANIGVLRRDGAPTGFVRSHA